VTAESDAAVSGASIDSRTIQPATCFFALRGERDGHLFVEPAMAAGASAAVVAVSSGLRGRNAGGRGSAGGATTARRGSATVLGKRVVCITGSAARPRPRNDRRCARNALPRAKSEGNLNNHLGLPLSLLRLEDAHDVGVFELAMSHAGEIAELAGWAKPDAGVVTCIAPSTSNTSIRWRQLRAPSTN